MDTLGYSVTRSYWSIFQHIVTSCRANDRPGLEDRRTNGIPELSMVSPEFRRARAAFCAIAEASASPLFWMPVIRHRASCSRSYLDIVRPPSLFSMVFGKSAFECQPVLLDGYIVSSLIIVNTFSVLSFGHP